MKLCEVNVRRRHPSGLSSASNIEPSRRADVFSPKHRHLGAIFQFGNGARICARSLPQIERIIGRSLHDAEASTFIRGMLPTVATIDLRLYGFDQILLDDVLARTVLVRRLRIFLVQV